MCSEKRDPNGIAYILIQPVAGTARTCRVVIPWKQGADLTSHGSAVSFKMENDVAEFTVKPDVVYALTPKGTRLAEFPMVKVGFKEACVPARLGNVWYGNREGANNHTSSFPLW